MSDFITIMSAPRDLLLTKTIRRGTETGVLTVTPYDNAKWYDADEVEITDHAALADVVSQLADLPQCAAVRGRLTPYSHGELSAGRSIRRLLRERDGSPPTLQDALHSWVMVDIDTFPCDLHDLQHAPTSVSEDMLATCLPALRCVTCYWHLSSTCGFAPGVGKAHLWFWLKEPRTTTDLKRWAGLHAKDIDDCVFSIVQLHFTANARLVGLVDPLPMRSGWLLGDEDEAVIPLIKEVPYGLRPRAARPPGEGVRTVGYVGGALLALGDDEGLDGFHRPLRTACMGYARDCVQFGRPRDDADFIYLLQTCIEAAPCRDGRRGRYLGEHYLTDLIQGAFRVVDRG